MLLGTSLGLPLLLANKTIANLDFLEAGRQKGKYHSDRHTHQQFPSYNNSQMVSSLRVRSKNIKMKIAIVPQQQNCEKKNV
jgi:hypothetical protein